MFIMESPRTDDVRPAAGSREDRLAPQLENRLLLDPQPAHGDGQSPTPIALHFVSSLLTQGSSGLASLILQGKRQLSKAHIRKLAEHFRVSPALFL